jgi:hypothetical protein
MFFLGAGDFSCSLKVLLEFLVNKNLDLVQDSPKCMDPDPDSENPHPKHCFRQRNEKFKQFIFVVLFVLHRVNKITIYMLRLINATDLVLQILIETAECPLQKYEPFAYPDLFLSKSRARFRGILASTKTLAATNFLNIIFLHRSSHQKLALKNHRILLMFALRSVCEHIFQNLFCPNILPVKNKNLFSSQIINDMSPFLAAALLQ